jgi:hypothetical protein
MKVRQKEDQSMWYHRQKDEGWKFQSSQVIVMTEDFRVLWNGGQGDHCELSWPSDPSNSAFFCESILSVAMKYHRFSGSNDTHLFIIAL